MCSTTDSGSDSGKNSALSIAYISPGWPAHVFHNGIATAIDTLTPALRTKGHRVTILAQNVAEEISDESVYDLQQIRKPRSPVQNVIHRVGYRLAPRRTHAYLIWRSILTAIRRARAERGIQIVEIEESFGIARFICQNAPIPICVRLHGPWFLNGPAQGYPRDDMFRRRVFEEGQAIQAAHAVTAVSNDVLNRVREFYGLALSNAEVIHGTVPAIAVDDRWKFKDAEPKTVLFVGRFDRHKGADLIVEAFAHVLQEMPDAQLWMVGPDTGLVANDGSKWKREEFIRDRLPGALEEGRIRSMGFQSASELSRLRRRAMVTVVCSRYETFSSATLEALTMGCPTVAAKIGGITEIVRDQDTGLFHRAEDPADLAAKIRILLTEPTHAAEMGHRAAQDCEQRFHPNVVADRFAKFFAQVVHRWNRGSRTA
jgi:glycosyltransferase involved in cell wall biosynthesis